MRSLSGAIASKIATRTGTEPIIVVEVAWKANAVHRYADKDHQNADGKIITISNFDSLIKLRGGQTTTVTLEIDDTDETIKDLFKIIDPHEATAIIYQSYDGISIGSNLLLFKGRINSPVVWDEGTRTVSFTIISDVESREVGFSPESGDFEFVDPTIIGKPWPICFGEVIRVPAQRFSPRIEGFSLTRYRPIN